MIIVQEIQSAVSENGGNRDWILILSGARSRGYLIADCLTHTFSVWSTGYERRKIAIAQKNDGLEVAIAIKLFEQQNGRLPNDASELVPDTVAKWPDSRMSGEPISFRTTEKGFVVDAGPRGSAPQYWPQFEPDAIESQTLIRIEATVDEDQQDQDGVAGEESGE